MAETRPRPKKYENQTCWGYCLHITIVQHEGLLLWHAVKQHTAVCKCGVQQNSTSKIRPVGDPVAGDHLCTASARRYNQFICKLKECELLNPWGQVQSCNCPMASDLSLSLSIVVFETYLSLRFR